MGTHLGSGPVLVVEDDPEVRHVLATLLAAEGYAVDTAADGMEALDRMRGSLPRVVLLDLMMPVIDGFEFRVRQLEDPMLAEVPVIVLSCGDDLASKTATLRAAACLMKPLDPDELLTLVDRLCDGEAPAAAGPA